MDLQTARRLSDLTTTFYAHVSASFSATRQAPWPGWQRVAKLAWGEDHMSGGAGASSGAGTTSDPGGTDGTYRVLDLACGNLRFARFAQQQRTNVRVWAVDNCDELATADSTVCYQHLDLAHSLLDGHDLSQALAAPPCDLCVCFGFMHHVPLPHHRAAVLQALVDHAAPGGLIAVSFWQFEHDARIMAKAEPLVDKGDYLLGWQGRHDAQRYCHSFDEGEIDELVYAMEPLAREVDRFSADGKSGNLNRYVVLRRA